MCRNPHVQVFCVGGVGYHGNAYRVYAIFTCTTFNPQILHASSTKPILQHNYIFITTLNAADYNYSVASLLFGRDLSFSPFLLQLRSKLVR